MKTPIGDPRKKFVPSAGKVLPLSPGKTMPLPNSSISAHKRCSPGKTLPIHPTKLPHNTTILYFKHNK
jgi:hypothetical protein